MKRIITALLSAAVLASPLYALDDKQAKRMSRPRPGAPEKAAAPMDINTATAKQLATLDGIGENARRPSSKAATHKGKDELVEKKIIPQDVWRQDQDKIIAKQAPEKKK